MSDFRYFTDVFADVVANVRLTIDPTNNILPIFKFGSYLELVASSAINDNNQQTKYPLIWLIWDSFEDTENWTEHDQLYEVNPRVFICTNCGIDESTEDCYTNYFKPVLYPILSELQRQLFFHENIESYIFNKFKKNDHPHWGENYTNNLFDTLSAIEINFQNLRIMKSTTC